MFKLDFLEAKINLRCNLNCSDCWDHSFVFKDDFNYDIEQFEQDLNILKQFISRISRFNIIGGEPLLNNNLFDYIQLIKRSRLAQRITIATNGLLIKSVDTRIFRVEEIKFIVNEYPTANLDEKEIVKFLDNQKVKYTYRSNCVHKFIEIDKKKDKAKKCRIYGIYPNLYNGYIYGCWRPVSTKDYRQFLGEKDCPDVRITDGLKLKDATWDRLFSFLKRKDTPLESCRYCNHD